MRGSRWVVYARSVDDVGLPVADVCSVVLVDDPGVAAVARERCGDRVMEVAPFVEDRVFNPIEWQRKPDESVPAVFVPVTRSSNHPALDGVIESGAAVYRIGEDPVGDVGAFVTAAKRHPVAVVDPTHYLSEASFLEQVMRLVACGTPVVTVASDHLGEVFPDGTVTVVGSDAEARAACASFIDDGVARERHSIRAREFVLQHHTARHRFDALLERCGIPTLPPQKVSILLVTKRPDFLEHAFTQIASQVYPHKELVVVLHGDDFDLDEVKAMADTTGIPVTVDQCPSTTTYGDCLNTAIDLATGDIVTKMDDDDYYGPNHINDLTTALHYSQADIVGKRSNFTMFMNLEVAGLWNADWTEISSRHLPGATMLMRGEVLRSLKFGRLRGGVDSDVLKRGRPLGSATYSTHPYNFVRVRQGDHTFTRPDEEFLEHTIGITKEFRPEDVFA